MISWLFTIGSLTGAILNARGKIAGFYVWIPANIAWVVWDWRMGEFSQAAVFIAFTAISVWGIYQWKRKGIK